MNPVREFLEKGDYSFEDGLAVLLAYSSNEGVNSFIASSRDRKHLHYELARLAHYPKLDPIPGRKVPKFDQPAKKAEEPKEAPVVVNPTVETPQSDDNQEGDQEEDTASFETIERHKHTRLEDMPTPMTRELWLKNRDEYKELQHCHQMMKEANSDAGRADWRKKVHQLSQSLKDRWQLIDSEIERYEEEVKAKASSEPAPAFNPLNYRSYISKALKKDQWDDATKAEVQYRVDQLLANGQAIGKETRERLAARGISL